MKKNKMLQAVIRPIFIILFIAATAFLIASRQGSCTLCGDSPCSDSPPTGQPLAETEKLLMLINEIPLGSDWQTVKQKFPALSEPIGEGGYTQTGLLTEAKTPVTIFDKPAQLEFNFENGKLYSFYYTFSGFSCDQARSLFTTLHNFYTTRLGPPKTESQQESAYSATTAIWNPAQYTAAATLAQTDQISTLSWGFQSNPQ